LQNVLMDEDGFKEYVRSGGGAVPAGDEFGGTSKPIKVEPAKESATNSRPAKSSKKVEPEMDDDTLDSSPF